MKVVLLYWLLGTPYPPMVSAVDMADMETCEQLRHEMEFTVPTYIGGYCLEVEFPQ